jgi:hypothetical protein
MRMESPETRYDWGEYRYTNPITQSSTAPTRALFVAMKTTIEPAIRIALMILAGESYEVAKSCSWDVGIVVSFDAEYYCTLAADRL